MSDLAITLVVVGPNRGKTFTFRDYQFVDGKIKIEGPIEAVSGAMSYLEKTCQAYPVGSAELANRMKELHGNHQVHEAARPGNPETVLGGSAKVPESREGQASAGQPGTPAAEAGGQGLGAEGSGSGSPENTNQVKGPTNKNNKAASAAAKE